MNNDLDNAVKILKNGGVIIFPTDTVYGIGCSIDKKKAEEKIYKIKNSPKNQKFPILISSIKQAKQMVKITQEANKLISKYWPGAVTLILRSKDNKKIGLRMPDSPEVIYLINKLKSPIFGSSANIHSQRTPKSFEELDPQLINKVDLVIKGNCQLKKESTVIDVTGKGLKILRQGAVKIK